MANSNSIQAIYPNISPNLRAQHDDPRQNALCTYTSRDAGHAAAAAAQQCRTKTMSRNVSINVAKFQGGMPMSLLYYGDYKFSFNESERNRSSSLRMTLLVCSAKLRVKIYSQVSASPKRLGVEHHIPCEAECAQDGQSIPCKSPTHPPS